MSSRFPAAALAIAIVLTAFRAHAGQQPADDRRTQFPSWLANSYFNVNVGFLQDAFTSRQLEPGFQAASIGAPHIAARVVLFGHEITPFLSVQLTYMRPVLFAEYRDVNADATSHSVWTGFGGATLRGRLPIAGRTSLYGEAGLGIAARHGFTLRGSPVVRDASSASVLLGAGVEYRLRPSLDLTGGASYIPAKADERRSRTIMIDGGFRYTMRALPQARVLSARESGFEFRRRLVQIEYSTGFGYSINRFVSATVPVFWEGNVQVDRGVALHYEENVFHTSKIFALDLGASVSAWRSRVAHDRFSTFAVYPLLRFFPLRTRRIDVYAGYSLAGPTWMSAKSLEGRDLGSRFTFQDFMTAGVLAGAQKHLSLGVKINHYSNGNIFPENAGVMIPVTFTAGWMF
jgi:hypothetical protein